MKVEIALEWFLNPDHLPFLVADEEGLFARAGLEVALIPPEGHYDGLAEVEAGRIAFACNEPLHMLDAKRPGLRALGCFFETEGGVMLTPDGEHRLLAGAPIRIASPVSAEPTNAIAREILRRHVEAKAGRFNPNGVAIVEAGFQHLENLKAGFDGAWLCFHNFEVVGAMVEGLPHVFVSTTALGLPNFSALELFTSRGFADREPAAVAAMQEALSEAIARIRRDPDRAGAIWRRRSGEEDSPLLRAILADTLPRFVAPVRPDPDRWRALFESFQRMGFAAITAEEYAALFG